MVTPASPAGAGAARASAQAARSSALRRLLSTKWEALLMEAETREQTSRAELKHAGAHLLTGAGLVLGRAGGSGGAGALGSSGTGLP